MPQKKSRVIGADPKKEALIRQEWRDFAKTTAFREMMEYADTNRDMLRKYSEDEAMPGPVVPGTNKPSVISLSTEKAHGLLQRGAGIGIITSYIRLYSE